jgi:probable rRNA maturation factor
VRVRIASEPGVVSPGGAAHIKGAAVRAIELGVAQQDRPIPFGLQPELEVHLTLTDDTRIRQLNREYRGQDKPTDVLSFSQIEGGQEFVPAPTGTLIVGDVVISVETAQRQAKGTLLDELRLLAVHGALHLLGYDHETDEDVARMDALTKRALEA